MAFTISRIYRKFLTHNDKEKVNIFNQKLIYRVWILHHVNFCCCQPVDLLRVVFFSLFGSHQSRLIRKKAVASRSDFSDQNDFCVRQCLHLSTNFCCHCNTFLVERLDGDNVKSALIKDYNNVGLKTDNQILKSTWFFPSLTVIKIIICTFYLIFFFWSISF